MKKIKQVTFLLLLFLVACQANTVTPTAITETPTDTITPTVTPTPIDTLTPTPTQPTSIYEQYTIDYLRKRTYGSGKIELVSTKEDHGSFTRYYIHYPSDGLTIYGFVNVPQGAGPFPIIIAIHGYVNPDIYQILDYTTDASDGLAQDGYIVLHPTLRNYPPSSSGDNLFRVGMAIDVLNLLELAKTGAGPAEIFNTAARDRIGLWSHSLGGDMVLRTLTISKDIKAAVLFASVSGDESKNARLMWNITSNSIYQKELNTAPEFLQLISPVNYYKEITSPIQLFHGTADNTVPITWAQENCDLLSKAGVNINCVYFPDEDHTFRSRVAEEFHNTLYNFYRKYLYP